MLQSHDLSFDFLVLKLFSDFCRMKRRRGLLDSMRFTIILVISVLLFFSAFGIYRVHIQKHFAEKVFRNYISEQGISSSNIERKAVHFGTNGERVIL